MAEQLTTLAAVKAWLPSQPGATPSASNNDAVLTGLIASASAMILQFVSRRAFGVATYSETYDGLGGSYLMLRQSPVLSVVSLAAGAFVYPAATPQNAYGYSLDMGDPDSGRILLAGSAFPRGADSIQVTYRAGYMESGEPHTVDMTSHQASPVGLFLGDMGVTYAASGLALLAVTGTPGAGQYRVTGGVYQFSTADAGASVLISYSTVPADVQQACIETVGERFRTRDHILETSRSLASGQTSVAYGTWDLNAFVKSALMPYRRVVPV